MTEREAASNPTVGRRLREWREHVGMTQGDLAEETGVGIPSISEFENGKREPTLSQLKKLADALSADVARLLSADEPTAAVVRWRERPANAVEIEARFLKLCSQYRDLERWCGEEEPVPLRKAEFAPPSTRAEVAALARQVQGEMQLGDRPGLVLRRRLEDDYGLKSFNLGVEPSGTAACTLGGTAVRDGGTPQLAEQPRRSARSIPRSRTVPATYVARHGCGHFEGDRREVRRGTPPRPCCFRRVLSGRRSSGGSGRIRKLSMANVCELARDFSVSIDALIWRMHNLYGWSDAAETRATFIALVRSRCPTTLSQPKLPRTRRNYRQRLTQRWRFRHCVRVIFLDGSVRGGHGLAQVGGHEGRRRGGRR